jgi:hypothetical protein
MKTSLRSLKTLEEIEQKNQWQTNKDDFKKLQTKMRLADYNDTGVLESGFGDGFTWLPKWNDKAPRPNNEFQKYEPGDSFKMARKVSTLYAWKFC